MHSQGRVTLHATCTFSYKSALLLQAGWRDPGSLVLSRPPYVRRHGMTIWHSHTAALVSSLANAAFGTVVALSYRLLSLTTSELALLQCGACRLTGPSEGTTLRIECLHDGPRRSSSMVEGLQATASLRPSTACRHVGQSMRSLSICQQACNAVWNSNQTRSASCYRPFHMSRVGLPGCLLMRQFLVKTLLEEC